MSMCARAEVQATKQSTLLEIDKESFELVRSQLEDTKDPNRESTVAKPKVFAGFASSCSRQHRLECRSVE